MKWGTLMFGNVTFLEGLHVTEKYSGKCISHTCSGQLPRRPARGEGGGSEGARQKSSFAKAVATGVPRS